VWPLQKQPRSFTASPPSRDLRPVYSVRRDLTPSSSRHLGPPPSLPHPHHDACESARRDEGGDIQRGKAPNTHRGAVQGGMRALLRSSGGGGSACRLHAADVGAAHAGERGRADGGRKRGWKHEASGGGGGGGGGHGREPRPCVFPAATPQRALPAAYSTTWPTKVHFGSTRSRNLPWRGPARQNGRSRFQPQHVGGFDGGGRGGWRSGWAVDGGHRVGRRGVRRRAVPRGQSFPLLGDSIPARSLAFTVLRWELKYMHAGASGCFT
jgi:hypothetical protein